MECSPIASVRRPLTGLKFTSYFRHALEDQQRMIKRVVSDDVSGFRHLANDIGPLLHVVADEKKRRLHFVLVARISNRRKVCGSLGPSS